MLKKTQKATYNNRFKSRGWTFFIFLIVMLTSIPLILAADWFDYDNYKTYENVGKYGKYKIYDKSIFGQDKKLMDLDLTENTERCNPSGCRATIKITLYENKPFMDYIRFMDMNSGGTSETTIEDYSIKYLKGNEWEEYNGQVMSGSKNGIVYEVMIEGKLKPFQSVDWQIKTGGVNSWLNEWAVWNSSLQEDLLAYYTFEENSGTVVVDRVGGNNLTGKLGGLNWTTGKVGNGISFNGSSYANNDSTNFPIGDADRSLSTWIYVNTYETKGVIGWGSQPSVRKSFTVYVHTIPEDVLRFATFSDDTNINATEKGEWIHLVLSYKEGSNVVQTYVNGVNEINISLGGSLETTNSNFTMGGSAFDASEMAKVRLDEVGIWNRTMSMEEVLQLYNDGSGITFISTSLITNLNEPINDLNTSSFANTFNCSVETITEDIRNLTLRINDVNNETVINSTGDTTFLDLSKSVSIGIGNHNWSCIVSTDLTDEFISDTRTLNINSLTENLVTFNNVTTEGNQETFLLNFTLFDGGVFRGAFLNYNNTRFASSSISHGGNQFVLSNTISIPTLDADANLTFFWEIESSPTGFQNTTSNTQLVLALSIDNCTDNNILVLNYTLKDEEFQNTLDGVLDNTTIEVDVDIFPIGSTTPIIEFSRIYNQTNPAQVCINQTLNNTNYRMDVVTRYFSTDRVKEFHHIQNFTLNNNTIPQNINLFDLLTVDSQRFLITFKDGNFLPVEDALIDIQRKYIADGVFKSVEITKTDENGQGVGHFDLEGVLYTITVIKNGVVLATFDNIAVICQDVVIGDCRIALDSVPTSTGFPAWNTLDNLLYTMIFNVSTRTIIATFVVVDGSTSTVILNATKFDRFSNETICDDTLTSSAGTLTCVIPESFGNVTVVAELFINGVSVTKRIYQILPDAAAFFGNDLGILILLLMITLPLMMVDSTITVIIGTIFGLIMASGLMIFNTGNLLGVSSVIIWAIIAGGIVIFKIAKRGG